MTPIHKRYLELIFVLLALGCESSGSIRDKINETMSGIIPRRAPETVETKLDTSATVTAAEKINMTVAEKINVTVAILPLSNSTLEIDGSDIMRAALVSAFTRKGFAVQPIDNTNKLLRDRVGITLGGQLDLATPQMIGDALCVDTLVYGKLVDYQMSTYGAYRINRVRGIFRFLDSTTGGAISEFGLGIRGEHLADLGGAGSAGVAITALGFITMMGNRLVNLDDNDPPWDALSRVGLYYTKDESEKKIEEPDIPIEVTKLAERVVTALTSSGDGSFAMLPIQLRSRTCTTSW